MYSNLEYIWKIYDAAKKNNIVIYMLSFSEVSINIIVEEKDVDEFSNILHKEIME